jgi:hypothetical protein
MARLRPALQDSEGRSKPWAGSRLVNAFAEQSEGDKSDQFAIMAIPGLTLFSDISSSSVRGSHTMGAALYVVVGGALYSVASDGAETSIGAIGGTDPVRMADNGLELAIVGGPLNRTGFVYSGGSLTTPVDLPDVTDVTYIDGYFVWTVADSDQFIISGIDDGLSYDLLDVATVEGAPDNLVGVINDHRELLFFGKDTTEIWYNSGAADFPFERQGNAFIEHGCIDRNSIEKTDNSVFFVGDDDRIVYRLNGYDPQRISTHAVETKLAGASWFRACKYSQEGHKFYILNTDVGTSCYDIATGAWADRLSFERSNYRVGTAVKAYGQTIFGDNGIGKLYVPDLEVYSENGDPMSVVIELPSIDKEQDSTLYAFEVRCETGVGNSDVEDPQIIMQYSRDGGRSWSNEMWRSLGRIGEYLTRAVWRCNADFKRQLRIRLTLPDKVRRFVMGYDADIR